MLLVIGFLIAGLIVGAILKNRIVSPKLLDKPINWAIYLLLFTLGVTAGSDEKIMSQLHNLGLTALVISIFTISGSIFVSIILFKVVFMNRKS